MRQLSRSGDPSPDPDRSDQHRGTSARPAVLVVDDDPLIRRLVSFCLTDAGFDVVEAPDGAAALDQVRAGTFAVVLLDMNMPRMSGGEVLRRLRADTATATLPVIMLTAAAGVEDRVAGLDAGADDYVTKPFSMEEIVARVRAQVRARAAWQETLAAHARRRSELARALAVAGRQTSLEATGHVICSSVAGRGGVASAVMVRFAADGTAVTVAGGGAGLWGLETGGPVGPALQHALQERAALGPWLQRGGLGPAGAMGPAVVACAPLNDGTTVHGVLMLGLADRRAPEATVALSGAIDLAAVTLGLMHSQLVHQRRLDAERADLRWMLSRGAFVPAYQPIVRLADGAVVGLEALTRFSDGSDVATRFHEAAMLGVGHELELATLRSALRQARGLAAGHWLSLNVSPSLLLEGDRLRSVLDQGERELILELSEHEAVADYDDLRRAVRTAGEHLRLSIDDAGAGFASLRHILRLEPAFVKLDRSWVENVDVDPARQALIAGLRHFADQTGAELIAEGIEREGEHRALVELGVEYGQGYLLGRPGPAG